MCFFFFLTKRLFHAQRNARDNIDCFGTTLGTQFCRASTVKLGFRNSSRAGLSLNYVLKYVGDAALSGLPMFSAASLVRTRLSML